MRYSKILLAIVLISMLVFGSSMSAYAVKSYDVTVSVGEGMGSVAGEGNYVYNAEVTVTATPVTGYEFYKWIMTCDGGTTEHYKASMMFNMHPHDVDLVACFKEIDDELFYDLYVTSNDDNMGTASGGGKYAYTQDVHVKATPKTGYQFDKWMVSFNDGAFGNSPFEQEFTCNLSHCGNGYFPKVELVAYFKPIPTTEPTTAATTEAPTEPTTAATTEAPTEPTTAATTEAPTQPTTAATTAATTEDDDEVVTITIIPTTSPATEATEVVTEEGVPLGAAGILNFDEIYEEPVRNFDEFVEDEPLVGTDVMVEDGEEVLDDEVPLADGLPQTGQLSADMFYGIGGLISGLGLWLKRKK